MDEIHAWHQPHFHFHVPLRADRDRSQIYFLQKTLIIFATDCTDFHGYYLCISVTAIIIKIMIPASVFIASSLRRNPFIVDATIELQVAIQFL
jgi:hypothetical protein